MRRRRNHPHSGGKFARYSTTATMSPKLRRPASRPINQPGSSGSSSPRIFAESADGWDCTVVGRATDSPGESPDCVAVWGRCTMARVVKSEAEPISKPFMVVGSFAGCQYFEGIPFRSSATDCDPAWRLLLDGSILILVVIQVMAVADGVTSGRANLHGWRSSLAMGTRSGML